ncbi:uncharacterized protein TM35_000101700 [Trypanosoma theileri]|uniref:Uncharacterized protein n=1 Tax=Trypanosoma theileri TaxID=67003 RepID=A0A1X0NYY8_9TRYP|nr:uncharacterized protein TM35_000101700 [Trypanosoma theileri]ORC89902.1 hypothetical protein TM35_000101700 [Trypanosoma theileri]
MLRDFELERKKRVRMRKKKDETRQPVFVRNARGSLSGFALFYSVLKMCINLKFIFLGSGLGPCGSMEEHLTTDQRVAGSSPVTDVFWNFSIFFSWERIFFFFFRRPPLCRCRRPPFVFPPIPSGHRGEKYRAGLRFPPIWGPFFPSIRAEGPRGAGPDPPPPSRIRCLQTCRRHPF